MLANEEEDFDYRSIKDMLQKDSNAFLKGVKNVDVDWFLRDDAINLTEGSKSDDITDLGASGLAAQDAEGALQDRADNLPLQRLSRTSSLEPGSHLQASISNTNESVLSKAKPSVATIHEEGSPTMSSFRRSSLAVPMGTNLSRKSSNGSTTSTGSVASSKGGRLFSKLKTKFGSILKELLPPASPLSAPVKGPQASMFKENYSLSGEDIPSISPSPSLSSKSSKAEPQPPMRTRANGDDPRLEEYIRFYKQGSLRSSSCCSNKCDSDSADHRHGALLNSHEQTPINISALKQPVAPAEPQNATGRLTSFLRRRSSVASTADRSRRMSETSGTIASQSPSPSIHNRTVPKLPEFADLKPLKSVAFHSLTFLMDPPQQIPSRNPRKGNVELLPNGSYRILPLSDEDKAAIEKSLMGRGGGIVVGGSGSLAIKKAPTEGDTSGTKDTANDVSIDEHAKSLGVEKPMISHLQHRYQQPVEKMALDVMYTRCCHLREILPIPAILKQIPKGSMAPIPILQMKNPTPTMVEVLTFADFIRIAPIVCVSLDNVALSIEQFKILLSAMSAKKQLEKLSLRNTPIDDEGWLLFCWFLSRNTLLNKLDVTQCPSLSLNVAKRTKRKPSADSKAKKEPEIKRMECNKENRSDMDWSLFTATIVARKGIEEVILTGCCITDFDVFEKFMKLAVLIKTNRLGLAYNKLTARQLRVIVDCWLFEKFVRGIDLGYNDLLALTHLNIFLEQQEKPEFEKKVAESQLTFLSLNSTNLRFSDIFKRTLETVLMKFPNLKYLDLSHNPKLFGHTSSGEGEGALDPEKDEKTQSEIVTYMSTKFPLFPKLIRLHLEHNDLSYHSLSTIANVLPFCKNLGYISILGNKLDLTTMTTLLQAVKNSQTLITLDCDIDEFPVVIKERLGLYSMRNMERLLYSLQRLSGGEKAIAEISHLAKVNSQDGNDGETPFILTEQLNNILTLKAQEKVSLDHPIVVDFVKRAMIIKKQLRATIDELLKLQLKQELSMDGKETLIRFVFLESSINKGLQMIDPSLGTDLAASIKMMGLSESRNSKFYLDDTDKDTNDALQLKAPTDDTSDLGMTKSPVNMSRTSSRTSLNHLDKEEGSMMKLLTLLKFHTFHHGGPSISGEEIRRKLRNVDLADLDEVIKYLSSLKEKGITVQNVFNLNNDKTDNKSSADDAIDFEVIKEKLKKMAISNAEGDGEKDANASESHQSTRPADETPSSSRHVTPVDSIEATGPALDKVNSPEYGERLNKLYDQVVNDYTKSEDRHD